MSESCPNRFMAGAGAEGHVHTLGAEALYIEGFNASQGGLWMVKLPLLCVLILGVLVWVGPARAADKPMLVSSRNGGPFAVYHDDLERAANQIVFRTNAGAPMDAAQRSAFTANQRAPELDKETVDRFALQYWGSKDRDLRSALARLQELRPTLAPILHSEHIPTELIAVVLVESAARPSALSSRGARGLWQLVPETARRYGLSVEPGRDERLDTDRATRAAARYLADLHDRFRDWLLALAAYNAGEDRVESAIERAGRADFSLLSARRLLPAETQNYVPAVISAAEMISGRAGLSSSASDRPQTSARTVYAEASGD